MELPSILVVGDQSISNTLIRRLTQNESQKSTVNDIDVYPFRLITKYYEAEVEFLLVGHQTIIQKQLQKQAEVFIFVFNEKQYQSFAVLKEWLPFIEENNFGVILCVATTSNNGESITISDQVHRQKLIELTKWCNKKGIEFISTDTRLQEEPDEDEGPFTERIGIERMMEALSTHMWPNMEYKTDLRPIKELKLSEKSGSGIDHDTEKERLSDLKKEDYTDFDPLSIKTLNLEELSFKGDDEDEMDSSDLKDPIFSSFGGGYGDIDAFEKTISQLGSLRDHTKSLPDQQRRELAASVAMSFLKQLENSPLDDEQEET